jgi:hypothetical protein
VQPYLEALNTSFLRLNRTIKKQMSENKTPAEEIAKIACEIGELIPGFNDSLGGESRGG